MSVRWVGPEWLRRWDVVAGWLPLWRADRVRIGDNATTAEMAERLGRLKYLEEVRVGFPAKLPADTIQRLEAAAPHVQVQVEAWGTSEDSGA